MPQPGTQSGDESEFDRIVRELHDEARREEAHKNGDHVIPNGLAGEWAQRYDPLTDEEPPPGSVPGGRFRRRYDWRKAAELLADGVDWRQACAAIGCRHKAMLRMLRHSAQFRRMIEEERRLRAEMLERRLEMMLLKVPFLIEKQINAGDQGTIRWLFRRLLGNRPNHVAQAFGEARPEKRQADIATRAARQIGRATTEQIVQQVLRSLPPAAQLAPELRKAAPDLRTHLQIAPNKDQ